MNELVRVVSKSMLLYLPQLVAQPGFNSLWLAVLSSLGAAAATGSETLSDASGAALQNLLIMLHDMVRDWQGRVGGWEAGPCATCFSMVGTACFKG